MFKILLVQTANSNLGDNVIADNFACLIRKIAGRREVRVFNYNIASGDIGQIKYADAVIMAGGILKVTNENFHKYFPEILNEAQRCSIPVYMGNIGVEAFYADDERSRLLKDAVNLPCIKGIGIRDDIETFRRDYLDQEAAGANGTDIASVIDVATWSSITYKDYLPVNRDSAGKPIGLGIVRHKLFPDYGHPEVTKEIQLKFWQDVITGLEEAGLEWQIFTNGDANDEKFAGEVLESVGHGIKLPAPVDGKELARMISGFRGVIAGRMHSNIISYALGIPSIGFVWNQKLDFWRKKIGYPERFMETGEIDGAKAVELLKNAMLSKCGPTRKMQKSIYVPLKRFLKKWVFSSDSCKMREQGRAAWVSDRDVDRVFAAKLKNKAVAEHLGSLRTRYAGTNSREAFACSLAHGYGNFQVDVRLTYDNEAVCVYRWQNSTYKMLGIDEDTLEDAESGISAEQFQKCRYFDRFHTMSFGQFIADMVNPDMDMVLKEYGVENEKGRNPEDTAFAGPEGKVILAMGKPSEESGAAIMTWMKSSILSRGLEVKNFILRVERKRDVEQARTYMDDVQLMYYFVPKKEIREDEEMIGNVLNEEIEYCTENNIGWIAFGKSIYSRENLAAVHMAGLRLCLFTDSKIDTIVQAISDGVDLVSSSDYDPDYLVDLICGSKC